MSNYQKNDVLEVTNELDSSGLLLYSTDIIRLSNPTVTLYCLVCLEFAITIPLSIDKN